MMSPILPPVSMNMAMTRQYRVMTAWMVVTVVLNSSTSALIETFMTDWSRTMMNWAPASASRGSRRFTRCSSRHRMDRLAGRIFAQGERRGWPAPR